MMFLFFLCFLMGGAWCNLVLPSDMKFGAGVSAFQSEGAWNVDGKSPSILDTYYRSNKSKLEPGEACKSYELYNQDIEMAKELGLQFYRFSIAWTRILPDGFSDNVNKAGVNYYNNLINKLLVNGIEPVVTLLQFDVPQCLQDLGGWSSPNFKDWFADYARIAFKLFGDRVKTWLTINEPLMCCFIISPLVYQKDQFNPHLVAKNLLLAHAKAWRVYDEEFRPDQNGMVSITNQVVWMIAESEKYEHLTNMTRQLNTGIYSHAVYSNEGGWPKDLINALAEIKNISSLSEFTDQEIKMIRGTYDFYALNYYTSRLVRKAEPGEDVGKWPMEGYQDLGIALEASPDWPKPALGIAVYPEGLRSTLLLLYQQYGVKKYFIMENGLSDSGEMDDGQRSDYIYKHLEQLTLAVNDGLQIIGYSVWSIMDDFELNGGYESKYGLYSVNFTDHMRTRTPRKSAQFYKSVISNATSGLPIVNPST